MTPDMMVVTDLAGRKISGERNASSELKMHLAVYELRPDVQAVVHAHPPLATGFAVAGIALDKAVLAEVICTLGSIPIADYATPSTAELPAAVARYIKAHDGLLLANHGALTVGSDLYNAYYKMETVEHFAQISLVARHARRRARAVARRGAPAAGAALDVRDRRAGADLHRRHGDGGRRRDLPGGAGARHRRQPAGGGPSGPGGRRRAPNESGRGSGNSANIPPACGPHRGCRSVQVGSGGSDG